VWCQAAIDATELEDIDAVLTALAAAVETASREAGERPAVMRIELAGRTSVHGTLARPGSLRDLTADVRSAALERDPWVWVDRIVDRTRPALDLETLRAGADFAGDLVRLTDTLLGDEYALRALVDAASGPALAALDTRDVPVLDAASLLERARDRALDRLLAEEER
jgi:hypothetical protein